MLFSNLGIFGNQRKIHMMAGKFNKKIMILDKAVIPVYICIQFHPEGLGKDGCSVQVYEKEG